MPSCDGLKYPFCSQRFHTPGIDQDSLSDCLFDGLDVFFFSYLQQGVRVKIHENYRSLLSPAMHPPFLQGEVARACQRCLNTFYGVQVVNKVFIFQHNIKSFDFCQEYCIDRTPAMAALMGPQDHPGKTWYCINLGVIKININSYLNVFPN